MQLKYLIRKEKNSESLSISSFQPMLKIKTLLFIIFFLVWFLAHSQTTVTFNSTGGLQNFTVPPCVTSINVTVKGGSGGGGGGGLGATVTGALTVVPGQVLQISVGGQGTCPGTAFGGGGTGQNSNSGWPSCGGGGASFIGTGGGMTNALVVAGGGGGNGGGDTGGAGGAGGCASGNSGSTTYGYGGGGGTQTSGGAGGSPWTAGGGTGGSGSFGQGGAGGVDVQYGHNPGGGGGGGWYGGGGAGSDNISITSFAGGGGGGGGSSLVPAGFACSGGNNSGPGQIVITYVATSPTLAVNSPSICQGQTAVLTATGGTTYTWQPGGATGNPHSVTPASTTIYTVTSGSGACIATQTAQVFVKPSPVPLANSNSPVCVNTPINFTGGGGGTYSWTGPGAFSSASQNPSIASAQVSNAGTYSLLVTGVNGCTASITTPVVVNPLPVIAVTNPTVCVNQTINLTSNGGATYSWSGPNGFSSASQNPSIPGATTSMSGAYTVIVTTAAGCTNSAVSNVTVITLPTPAISHNTPCVGATLTFTGSGGTTYSWSGPNGFSSATQNPTIPNVSLAAGGTYSLVATIGTCSNIITSPVVINPLPVPTATSNSPVCLNTPINFTGGGGGTYSWAGPNGYSSATQNPVIASAQATNNGTYTLTVTNASGCTNTITTGVTVNPLPVIAVNNPTVCVNQNINLTSNGGSTYSWSGPNAFSSALQNPTITNASLSMTGAYTVIVTTAAGCTASAVSNVSVITLPVAGILSNTPCVGSTLTFTGSGGISYAWNGPNGFASGAQNPTIPNVSLAANGVYTLVATAGTCSNSTTQLVTINPLPVPTATSNSAVCANTAINFTGTGGTTYTWTGPGFTSNQQNPTIASASAANAGTYTLSVTNANGCVNFTTTSVVVNPLPVVVVNNPTACVNQNLSFTSTGGGTYSWSGPQSYASNVQNPVITNATTLMTGPYTVLVTSAAGCTASAVSNATVIPLPVPSIGSNTPCVGASLNLNASGGTNYSWTGPNGFSSGAQNPSIPNVSLAANGMYSLTVTIGMCSAGATASITINPLPTPAITSNGPVCLNQPVTFTATGGNSYSWSGPNGFTANGNTAGIISASGNNAGTYIVTATDGNNCTNMASYQLVVNSLPVIAVTGATVCEHQFINLSANGGNVFVWSGPAGFNSNSPNPVIPNASTSMAGIYAVTVTDANSCSSTSLTNVVVNTLPTPSATCNSPICANQTITLSSGAPTGVSYQWSGPNGYLANGAYQQILPANPTQSGIYMITVTDNIGCSATATVNMIVNPLPDAAIVSTETAGCIPFCITFSCQSLTPLQFISWDFGSGTNGGGLSASKCYNKDGSYKVSANYTDINGCSNSSTINVTAYPIPTADFNYAPRRPVDGEQVDFTSSAYGQNIVGYSWSFSQLGNNITMNEQNPSIIFPAPGGYVAVLIVTSDKGCVDTLIQEVIVAEDYGLYVPNAFTPNGDGVNDIFQPKGFGIVTYELNIFDRWGEKLFTTHKFEEGWVGNYVGRNDEPVEQGVYVWHIKLLNVAGKALELTGKVTLTK